MTTRRSGSPAGVRWADDVLVLARFGDHEAGRMCAALGFRPALDRMLLGSEITKLN